MSWIFKNHINQQVDDVILKNTTSLWWDFYLIRCQDFQLWVGIEFYIAKTPSRHVK